LPPSNSLTHVSRSRGASGMPSAGTSATVDGDSLSSRCGGVTSACASALGGAASVAPAAAPFLRDDERVRMRMGEPGGDESSDELDPRRPDLAAVTLMTLGTGWCASCSALRSWRAYSRCMTAASFWVHSFWSSSRRSENERRRRILAASSSSSLTSDPVLARRMRAATSAAEPCPNESEPDAMPLRRYPLRKSDMASAMTIHLDTIGSPTRRVHRDRNWSIDANEPDADADDRLGMAPLTCDAVDGATMAGRVRSTARKWRAGTTWTRSSVAGSCAATSWRRVDVRTGFDVSICGTWPVDAEWSM